MKETTTKEPMSIVKKITLIAISVLLGIYILFNAGKLAEDVEAGEIVVIQDPYDGELHVITTPGFAAQNFGRATHYKKSFQYWFDGKEGHFAPISTKFYDGGHAAIPGSIRVDMPLDIESILKIHTKFGSQEAIENSLIGPTLTKAISMCGPLMTSKESYAEKKNDLLYYIEDQASFGVYKTTQKDVKVKDELTGQEKTVTAVKIITDTTKNLPIRQERSLITENNIRLNNLSLGDFIYDDVVKNQIAMQQDQIMKVQTGIANAKRAEQDAITTEQQGRADAAKAKWTQEVIKAKFVTEAQQDSAVQALKAHTAKLYKSEQILIGEGNAERKKLEFQANGALEQKLAAYQNVQKYWADAFSKYTGAIVPQIQSGSNGSYNGATNFMELMGAKAAKDLALDLKSK